MEDVDKHLNNNASPEEREAAALIGEGLASLRRQKKVATAAASRARLRRRQKHLWLLVILLFLLGGLTFSWWWSKSAEEIAPKTTTIKETSPAKDVIPVVPVTPQEDEVEEEMVPEQNTNKDFSPPVKPSRPQKNIPIARTETTSLPPPAYGAPNTYLRGQSGQKKDQALLDQLWYTDYPLRGLEPGEEYAAVDELLKNRTFTSAYVRLQRLNRELSPNDTLRYLQAYTLLEMGQGQEALLLLDQITTPPLSSLPQLQWYRGLAALLADDRSTALVVFRDIAAQSAHPYQRQARKALVLYDK